MSNYASQDTITISGNLAYISSSDWISSIILIRNGMILSTLDGGQAIITKVTSIALTLDILKPFRSSTYLGGEWKLEAPTEYDISQFLPEAFSESPLIRELYSELQYQINDVDDSVLRLLSCRDPSKLETEFLPKYLYDNGIYTVNPEITTNTLRRLSVELTNYYINKGRKSSYDFLGIGYNAQLSIYQMWSKDLVEFVTKDEIPISSKDEYYPTNYVRINVGSSDDATLKDFTMLKKTFYELSWICLALLDITTSDKITDMSINIKVGVSDCCTEYAKPIASQYDDYRKCFNVYSPNTLEIIPSYLFEQK